jgi:acetyl esterase/lipase
VTYEVQEDIQYGVTENHMLDIYQPDLGGKPAPTLLLMAGSGFLKIYMTEPAEFFARQGYAVITFNRSSGQYPTYERDSFCALAWIHNNAETYGFDTSNVIPIGFSLGGDLAAFIGTVDDTSKYMEGCPHTLPEQDYVRAIVTVAGFFDFAVWIPGADENSLIYNYFGPPDDHMEEICEASPIGWVDGSEPPFLVVHGENDTVVDPNQSIEFAQKLENAGVDVELVLMNLIHDQIVSSPKLFLEINRYLSDLLAE